MLYIIHYFIDLASSIQVNRDSAIKLWEKNIEIIYPSSKF